MEKLLIHITELASWVSYGRLKINLSRLINFTSNSEEYCFRQMLEEFGNVRTGDPEAYVITTLDNNWREYIKEPHNPYRALFQTIDLRAVNDIQPLTRDSAIRLGSQIERLAVKLSSPDFENIWIDYQKKIKFEEAREGGKDFINLFTFPDCVKNNIASFDDSQIEAIYRNVFSMEAQKILEECKGTSEYGLMEFMISLSSTQTNEWRDSNEDYLLLKSERKNFLSKQNWNKVSFLENEKIITLVQKFDELSLEKLSFDSVSLISFYKHRAEFILNNQKINFISLKKDIELMLSLEFEESIFTLLNLLGIFVGLENLMYIKHNLHNNKYSIFEAKEDKEFDPQNFVIALEIDHKTLLNTAVLTQDSGLELSLSNDPETNIEEAKNLEKSLEVSLTEKQDKSVELKEELAMSADKLNEVKES